MHIQRYVNMAVIEGFDLGRDAVTGMHTQQY